MGTSRADAERMMQKVGKPALFTGIDPGVHTGFAVWSPPLKKFTRVESMMACEAEHQILMMRDSFNGTGYGFHVVVEDTRKMRMPAHLQNAGRLKGVGSVHCEMRRWDEFLTYHSIPHTMAPMSPKEFRTGNDAWFRKKTGWDKRTNEHARAASGLVWMR